MHKWCTYGPWGKKMPSFIGQLVEQTGNTGKIRYAERQMYPLEYWDMDYVEVFETIEDAIKFMLKNGTDRYLSEIKECFNFPSTNVDWDKINL